MTLLPVSLQVGGRPHIRAPRTVEKIMRRDRRNSRHIHALTLEPEHDIESNGQMDDIRRSSRLTPRSSMDSGILFQKTCLVIFYITYRPHGATDRVGGGSMKNSSIAGSRGMIFCALYFHLRRSFTSGLPPLPHLPS